ncbi:MAG: WD40/YVTN/BNR-like repeat-containing protein [Candidatus Dormibacteria bacterium]
MSFISARVGYVLGTTATCPSAPCTTLVRTFDGGQKWQAIPAPRAPYTESFDASSPLMGVNRVRFANGQDGWAFGPGLDVTHNGGATWQAVSMPGAVTALEAVNGRAYALVASGVSATGSGTFALYSSPVKRTDFKPLPEVSATGFGPEFPGPTDPIALHSSGSSVAGFVLLAQTGTYPPSPALYATSDGIQWARFPDPCTVTGSSLLGLTSFAMPDVATLDSLCSGNGAMGSTQKEAVRTAQGQSVVLGTPGLGGDGGQLAAPTTQDLLLATASAASWIYRSADGGATWSTATFYDDGGVGFADFGCTTATQCVAIHGQPRAQPQPPGADALIMSNNGGMSWHDVAIG